MPVLNLYLYRAPTVRSSLKTHTSCPLTETVVAKKGMKQYVIDELRPQDHAQIKAYLKQQFGLPEMESVYWVPLSPSLLNPVQAQHTACEPFYIALELEEDRLVCELLVRTKARVRCDCIGYATAKQRNWLIELVDAIFEKLVLQS